MEYEEEHDSGSWARARDVAARALRVLRLDSPTLRLTSWILRRRPSRRAVQALAWAAASSARPELGPWEAKLRTGGRLLVNLAEYAHRRIFFYGTYEEDTSRYLARVVNRGSTVFDVGANAGYFSVLAADLGARRVIAFEPNPHLAGLLRKSARLNPRAEIEIEEAACGVESGSVILHLSDDPRNSGLSTVRKGLLADERTQVAVRTVSLDDYCEERDIWPDVVKIDVEGLEQSVV